MVISWELDLLWSTQGRADLCRRLDIQMSMTLLLYLKLDNQPFILSLISQDKSCIYKQNKIIA